VTPSSGSSSGGWLHPARPWLCTSICCDRALGSASNEASPVSCRWFLPPPDPSSRALAPLPLQITLELILFVLPLPPPRRLSAVGEVPPHQHYGLQCPTKGTLSGISRLEAPHSVHGGHPVLSTRRAWCLSLPWLVRMITPAACEQG